MYAVTCLMANPPAIEIPLLIARPAEYFAAEANIASIYNIIPIRSGDRSPEEG